MPGHSPQLAPDPAPAVARAASDPSEDADARTKREAGAVAAALASEIPQPPAADGSEHRQSGYRAFDPALFLEWGTWERIREILANNGGSYGLTGPRGAGKSWHMDMAIHWAESNGGFGFKYPSPSEYDPNAFLASLSDNMANAIERRFERESTLSVILAASRWPLIGGLALMVGAGVWALATTSLRLTSNASLLVAGFVAYLGAFLLFYGYIFGKRALRPEHRLVREATLLRERIRYAAMLTQASEIGASLGQAFVGSLKASRERQLTERPTTVSTLVYDFRELARHIARVASPVVIAIDELDKMSDPVKVRELLRQVKGIFEVPGVHFLVSVSSEAASTLKLGAIEGRNEFSSSFYTVIEFPPLRADQCSKLLSNRGYSHGDEVDTALSIMSGGNARELVRLGDIVAHAGLKGAWELQVAQALGAILWAECTELQHAILKSDRVSDEEKLGAFLALPGWAFAGEEFVAFTRRAPAQLWSPGWETSAWKGAYAPSWRKLLVRLVVCGYLQSAPTFLGQSVSLGVDHQKLAAALQEIVLTASESGTVALRMMAELDPEVGRIPVQQL